MWWGRCYYRRFGTTHHQNWTWGRRHGLDQEEQRVEEAHGAHHPHGMGEEHGEYGVDQNEWLNKNYLGEDHDYP
jgi:hypothetical protein